MVVKVKYANGTVELFGGISHVYQNGDWVTLDKGVGHGVVRIPRDNMLYVEQDSDR